MLYKNKVYLFTVFTLISQFFTVSVFLFWGTSFFEVVLNIDKNLAMITTGVVCITSPVFGVLLGGYISDRSGGVRDVSGSFLICFKLTLVSYMFINIFTYFETPIFCVVALWIGIAFGEIIFFFLFFFIFFLDFFLDIF
jgi:hypothetical protein